MPTIERTPRQKALLTHLGGQEDLVRLCDEAINLGQSGANGEFGLFSHLLTLPNGRQVTVEQAITDYHLNSFIEWGGGDT